MSNGELHAREREDLSLHVERCAERYTAVREETLHAGPSVALCYKRALD